MRFLAPVVAALAFTAAAGAHSVSTEITTRSPNIVSAVQVTNTVSHLTPGALYRVVVVSVAEDGTLTYGFFGQTRPATAAGTFTYVVPWWTVSGYATGQPTDKLMVYLATPEEPYPATDAEGRTVCVEYEANEVYDPQPCVDYR